MTPQQKGPFEKLAKEQKLNGNKEEEKYTSQGIPVSHIENEQRQVEDARRTMTQTIKQIVDNAFINNSRLTRRENVRSFFKFDFFPSIAAMGSQEYFFISGIYFARIKEDYLPAELAMVKFTFENGVVSKFHSYINPGMCCAKLLIVSYASYTSPLTRRKSAYWIRCRRQGPFG